MLRHHSLIKLPFCYFSFEFKFGRSSSGILAFNPNSCNVDCFTYIINLSGQGNSSSHKDLQSPIASSCSQEVHSESNPSPNVVKLIFTSSISSFGIYKKPSSIKKYLSMFLTYFLFNNLLYLYLVVSVK